MRVLVIGSGAREHAIVGKLAIEAEVEEVICSPGNPGISVEPKARCVPADIGNPRKMLDLARGENVTLTIVGPELPLANGISDVFSAAGCEIFGPSRRAARLESSKVFAKAFMTRNEIPTAQYEVCTSEQQARSILDSGRFGYPVVVKADGLAAGKGVTVAADRETAESAVQEAMVDRRFGEAGASVVFEECLTGTEVSYFVVSDGQRVLALPSAQDHKRAFNDDLGPNTGGMGAFAPSPLMTSALEQRIMQQIVMPTIDGLGSEGIEYRGVLYVGLMLTESGPKVIEFNVRFGDPEAQVILPMIESDLAPVLSAAARGDLRGVEWRVSNEPHVGVVMASGGYPRSYVVDVPISGLDDADAVRGVRIDHAGTARKGGKIVTAGGRVLTVVGRGGTYKQAIESAYEAVGCISFDGSHFRTDIGSKAHELMGANDYER